MSSVLKVVNPKGLQRAVFFYVGKCFCIRGGQEQRLLGPPNFSFLSKPGSNPHCVSMRNMGLKISLEVSMACVSKIRKFPAMQFPAMQFQNKTLSAWFFF